MERKRGSTASGEVFAPAVIAAVWEKAGQIMGQDSASVRKDACGAPIRKASYGTTGEQGWEIDHIKPVLKGGNDQKNNLQPLHWSNNRSKGDEDALVCQKTR